MYLLLIYIESFTIENSILAEREKLQNRHTFRIKINKSYEKKEETNYENVVDQLLYNKRYKNSIFFVLFFFTFDFYETAS